MTPAESAKPNPARRGLWLIGFAMLVVLGISTWDAFQYDSGKALRRAAREGDVQRIEKILRRHPELANNRGNKSLKTRLLEKWGNERLVRLNWDEFEGGEAAGFTALHWAAVGSNLVAIKLLLAAGASPDTALEYGDTPLGFAIEQRQMETVHLLIKAGANVNLTHPPRANALVAAVHYRGDSAISITKLLLESGANPNPSLTNGTTLLHYAAWNGAVETIQLLASSGAKISDTNSAGLTPLDYAMKRDKTNAMTLLKRLGATP